MTPRRKSALGLAEEFSHVYDRIRQLEEVQSGRVLPVGYIFKELSDGTLVIQNRETGAQIVLS